jgi:hypothetical protein
MRNIEDYKSEKHRQTIEHVEEDLVPVDHFADSACVAAEELGTGEGRSISSEHIVVLNEEALTEIKERER